MGESYHGRQAAAIEPERGFDGEVLRCLLMPPRHGVLTAPEAGPAYLAASVHSGGHGARKRDDRMAVRER